MAIGYLSIVLHAHLPFVRHPEYPDFLEEDWLYEAISETYLPLLVACNRLRDEGVKYRVTMSMTPPLCEMLSDPLLQDRYIHHINRLCELAEKEVERTQREALNFHSAALMYRRHFNECREVFVDQYQRNILHGFRQLQDQGYLEIISCCATHGFLPLMSNEAVKRAQILIARDNYVKHFGRPPRGMWLAECAFNPGDDRYLREAGIKFFIADAHAILYGNPRPRRGIYAPTITPTGVAVFARDTETSEQVWSSQTGYPGDALYREFYRDLGYDAYDYEYIRPYLHNDGVRRNIGVKYHRITGKVPLHEKEPYVPEWATDRAAEHAGNFMFNRQAQARHLNHHLGRAPMIIAPYDAELFGHWWFEGPQFLYYLFKKLHYDQDDIQAISPIDYLQIYQGNQRQTPSASSWGAEGYNRVWINGQTDWMYMHQHAAERRMVELAQQFPEADGLLKRALNQAARELLLAQSSDWAFIITTGTMVQYAVKRFKDHIHRFTKIYDMINQNQIDEGWLADAESKDTIFQEIDYRVYGQSS
ncbi:MAG TPA: 1,4-alpha-glucan branching protein domain-containing protein [Blastocatellia bacterium]|nr:1,4-alpha-glucan branching protein domain-containing protein [Blastocatellia bacterium]